jgi:hypothetical protein
MNTGLVCDVGPTMNRRRTAASPMPAIEHGAHITQEVCFAVAYFK